MDREVKNIKTLKEKFNELKENRAKRLAERGETISTKMPSRFKELTEKVKNARLGKRVEVVDGEGNKTPKTFLEKTKLAKSKLIDKLNKKNNLNKKEVNHD